MSASGFGRGFEDLPIEEQVKALRDHAIAQELLIAMLLTAVKRLGVEFVWPGETGPPESDGDEDDAA